MSDTADLRDDAPRYVAEALKKTGHEFVAIDDLVDNYALPRPNNLPDLRDEIRGDLAQSVGKLEDHDVKRWLIRDAVQRIDQQSDALEHDENGEKLPLTEDVDIDTVDLDGEPLIRRRVLPDLFDPQTGPWANNIRTYSTEGLKELRESMTEFGWLRHLPAIQDENGVVLVGHRRLDVAADLGIKPVIETVRFGEGEAGVAARAALTIASNVGAEKMNQTDRKKIAADLYGQGWSMPKIGKLLKVATMTISRDLSGLTGVKPSERGGRPRKQDTASPSATLDAICAIDWDKELAADPAVDAVEPDEPDEPKATTTPAPKTSVAEVVEQPTSAQPDRQGPLVEELTTLVAETGKVTQRLSTQTLTTQRANLIQTQISPALREMSIALLNIKVVP
jgi:hypothetical protein